MRKEIVGIVEPRQFAWFGLVVKSKYSLELNSVETLFRPTIHQGSDGRVTSGVLGQSVAFSLPFVFVITLEQEYKGEIYGEQLEKRSFCKVLIYDMSEVSLYSLCC